MFGIISARRFFRRSILPALLGLVLLLGLVSVFNLTRTIGQPFGGFFVYRNLARNAWQVEASTPPWWPVIEQGQLTYVDRLITLEGQPYGADAAQIYAAAARRGQTTVRLTIERGAARLDRVIALETFQWHHFLDIKLPDLITGLGFWLLAVAVYAARPAAAVNRVFAIGFSLVAAALWLTLESVFPELDALSQVVRLSWIFATALMSAAFMHLLTLFPVPWPLLPRRRLSGLYAGALVIALAYAGSLCLWWLGYRPAWSLAVSAIGFRVVMAFFGLAVAVYLARLGWLLVRPAPLRLRRQLRVLLLGMLAAFPYVAIIVWRTALFGSESYFWFGLDLRYLSLAVPFVFAFVILRYQTFQSRQPLLMGTFILASSALVASVSAWVFQIVQPRWREGLSGSLFPLLFMLILLVSLFWSVRRLWEGLFYRLFQWEQRSYAAVRQVGQQVVSQTDLSDLPHVISQALVQHLQIEQAAVWLWHEKELHFSLAGQAGFWLTAPPPSLRPLGRPVLRAPLRLERGPVPDWLAATGVEIAVPLWTHGQLMGVLGLGRRGDEEIFDERDLEIIDLIGQQSALFLLTVLQIEQLRQVPHQVATAQERERFKLAQELHDTVQQFLGRLPFYLEVSRSAIRTDPASAENLLHHCLTEVENAAQTLRQILHNLAPVQLQDSLEAPLRALVAQFTTRTGVEVRFSFTPGLEVRLTPEVRHALYRVAQQALDNIAAHAYATDVSLGFALGGDQLDFTIIDNGVGMTEEQRLRAVARGSFGLQSMEARIAALGGELAIRSAHGVGTQVVVKLAVLPVSAPAPAPPAQP